MATYETPDDANLDSGGLEQVMGIERDPAPCPSQFSLFKDEHDNLKTGCFWIDNHPLSLDERFASCPLPDEVDVVIIGSGITGAAAAYRLAEQRPGLRVAVIEARGICTGATGRNGGHIGRPEVYDYKKLADKFGPEEALRVRKLLLRNRDMTLACLDRLGSTARNRVDVRLKGTMVVFETEEERLKFDEDRACARAQGYREECTIMSRDEVLARVPIGDDKARHGAAWLENSGTVYPRKLVGVLFEAAAELIGSFTMHPNTPVTGVCRAETGEGYVVQTSRGDVRAGAVLHATNGYSSRLLPSMRGSKGVVGCQAHMLGVQPPPEVTPSRQLDVGFGFADFWHWIQQRPKGGPFLYGLATAERVGEYDDSGTIDRQHPVRLAMYGFLRSAFGAWFPGTASDQDVHKYVAYDWTGVQGFTIDGASIVGRSETGSPGEFLSVGHNGEGMTKGFACATVVVDMMLQYLDGKKSLAVPDWFPRSYFRDEVAAAASRESCLHDETINGRL